MADTPRSPEAPTRSPEELRRWAGEIRAEARKRAAEWAAQYIATEDQKAQALENAADRLEDAMDLGRVAAAAVAGDETGVARLVDASWGLPSETDSDTLGAMDTSGDLEISPRGPRFKASHPLVERARELKKPIHAVASELEKKFKRRFPRSTVRSWYVGADSDAARPIPEDVAEYFSKKPWNIPLRAWASVRDK